MPNEILLELAAGCLTYAVHSTAILGLTWLALKAFEFDALVRSRAWKLGLLGGLLTTTVQLTAGFEPIGGAFTIDAAARSRSLGSEETVQVHLAPVPADPEFGALLAERLKTLPPPESAPTMEEALRAGGLLPPEREPTWRRALILAWISGATWGLFVVSTRRGRFRRRIRDRLPVWDESAKRMVADLTTRAGVRRPVKLTRSRTLRTPATWGWLRPEICLPDRALAELAPDELEAVIAHELGHVKRGDALWLTLTQALDALCFFQPLNRVARRGLARESEHLADAFAVDLTGRPVSLARSLARVATWIDPSQASQEPAVATMAASRSALLDRVERLLARSKRKLSTRKPTVCFLALPLTSILLLPSVAVGSIDRASDSTAPSLGRVNDRTALEPAPLVAMSPPASSIDVSVESAVARLIEDVRVQIDSLSSELSTLESLPAADEHRADIERLRIRIERLADLGDRVTAYIAHSPLAEPDHEEASVLAPQNAVPSPTVTLTREDL
ncbi:MAG: M56 family metallopeptidase [Planctomycetota bacterium]|jgi:beta-lactamase regulating signal transducer with metallopeptidase domain